MKHSERQHLRDNELALVIARANQWRGQHQKPVIAGVAIAVVALAAVIGVVAWRSRVDGQARARLAEAMVTYEARVTPPTPPLATSGNVSPGAPVQPANTFPTERAKLEAALPKFMAAADAYPTHDVGVTARFHAAAVLLHLDRFDEAAIAFDRVIAGGSGLLAQSARLGKAEAELRGSKHDAAIASFKTLAEQTTTTGLPKEAILLELARAYRIAGKSDDARRTLTQIVEQHAESPYAAEARSELEKLKGA